MNVALDQQRNEKFDVRAEDVARLSPLGLKHVNMLGRSAFTLPIWSRAVSLGHSSIPQKRG
jgi:hypothetical protein